MENLRHFTPEPFVFDKKKTYTQPVGYRPYSKPCGLWMSPLGEYDWPSWCRETELLLERLEYENVVELHEDANLLIISDDDSFIAFDLAYRRPDLSTGSVIRDDWYGIDWQRVATDYSGIFIVPYLWKYRMSHEWYYTWDVASGCVWDLTAIKSVTEKEKVENDQA